MRICEITLKKGQTSEGQKRPDLLNRKIEVPDLKRTVRLKVSAAGIEALKAAGGVTKFLEEREEKKLTPKLRKLKAKLIEAGKIKVKAPEPEPTEEAPAKAEAPAEGEAPAEEVKAEEAPKEEAKEEKPAEEAPKEEAKAEEAPAEEAKEEKPAEEAPKEEEKSE